MATRKETGYGTAFPTVDLGNGDEFYRTDEGILFRYNADLATPAWEGISGGKTTAKARAYLGTTQEDLADNTWTKVLLDTETYDLGSNFASNKFVAPISGYYQVDAVVEWASTITDKKYFIAIYVDGSAVARTMSNASLNANVGASVSDCVYLTAGQEVELYVLVDVGAATVDISAGEAVTYMSIHLLSVNLTFQDEIGKSTAKARAYLSADQEDFTSGIWTKILLNAETYDPGDNFASNKFVAPVSGWYQINASVAWHSISVVPDKRYIAAIYVDGASVTESTAQASVAQTITTLLGDSIYLTAGQYVELWVNQISGANTVDVIGGEKITYLTAHLLSV